MPRPIPLPPPLMLKSPIVSPQTLLPSHGLPVLTTSSRQDNSIRNASPIEPSLRTGSIHRRSRILLFSGHRFTVSYGFLIPRSLRTSALPLSIFLSTYSSDTGRRRSLYSLVAFFYFPLPGLGQEDTVAPHPNKALFPSFPSMCRRIKSLVTTAMTPLCAFSIFRERDLSLLPTSLPSRLRFPSGLRTPLGPWTSANSYHHYVDLPFV